MCYPLNMTKTELKEILDRVLTWPPERQADVAHMVELMEEQDNSALRLTDEQAAGGTTAPCQVEPANDPRRSSLQALPLVLSMKDVRARRQRRT